MGGRNAVGRRRGVCGASGGRRAWRARRLVTTLTLATPAGLLLARLGRARLVPGPRGTVLALDYALAFPAPRAPAVTVGHVVLLRLDEAQLARRPGLLEHEARHADQWASGLGLLGFPLAYGLASLWSWLVSGDAATANVFERGAGLADGGYGPPDPSRRTCRGAWRLRLVRRRRPAAR